MDKLRKLINDAKRVQKQIKKVSVTIAVDGKGYIDKECPNSNCLFQFKVNAEDWKNKFQDSKVFCPNCKNESPANTYYPTHLIKEIKDSIISDIRTNLIEGKNLAFQNYSFKSFKEWELEIICEFCNSRYSVIGSAFFCPCCGNNSIKKYLADAIRKVEIKLQTSEIIRKENSFKLENHEIEILAKSIIESCLSDCVVIFQHYLTEVYKTKKSKSPKFNLFQRIDEGSKEWKKEFGKGYEDWVSNSELELMKKLFQQRHLFAHNEGIVDQKYINKSGDKNYTIGQRIVVNKSEITELLLIIQKIISEINNCA